MLKIGISGACGRMGRRIADIAVNDPETDISVALERRDAPEIGESYGKIIDADVPEIKVVSDLDSVADEMECLIDFTLPEPTIEHVKICSVKGVPMVIGTTGLDAAQEDVIKKASEKIPIVFSPNMSIGVNVLFNIVREAARVLGRDFDIKVDETHHVHKKDSPSGTAKMIGKVIKEAAEIDAPIEAFREGEVVGNHGIVFESGYETLEIRHDAKSRDVFAAGAVKAAKYAADKPAGLYSMADVLGIKQ